MRGPARFRSMQTGWRWYEIVFWAAAFAMLVLAPSRLLLLNEIAIFALLALSLDLILGFAGIVSLGHAAFFGVGAYTAGLLAKHFSEHALLGDPTIGLGIAALTAAIIGFASSFLVLRGSDLTRLMVTLGVALIVQEIANRLDWITGGADGLQGVLPRPVLGAFEFDLYGRTAATYSLVVLFIAFVVARQVVHAPFGLGLKAIRDNRLRAEAIGIPVNRRLIAIYTLAAALAGMAGALLAQTTQFASLDMLDFQRSAEALLMLVIGGAGNLFGGLLGAIVFAIAHDVLKGITAQYWQFWLGLSLIILVLFARGGLTGLLRLLYRRVRPEAAP
ncbi:MAG: branched-chain amino acid ABC transporter permease [Beijerinckiaceae bacterium]|nr:branched-chain amino acid ABC transporter permease [Beijerinckiaceae bacterium]